MYILASMDGFTILLWLALTAVLLILGQIWARKGD